MKFPQLGDYLFWGCSNLAKIVGIIDSPAVIIELQKPDICPQCGKELEKHRFTAIPGSPQFKDTAEPVPTIDDPKAK